MMNQVKRTLICDGAVMQGAGDSIHFPTMDILVEDGKIMEIGTNLKEMLQSDDEANVEIVSARGKWVLPGFVNTHNHAGMSLLRCFSDDKRLMEWLSQKMLPAEEKMTPDDIYWGTQLAMLEMVQSGTTTFADMYVEMDRVAAAVEEAGMRASLCRGMVFLEDDGGRRLNEALSLFETWHGKADGRIQVMLGPHAPFTCPPESLRMIRGLAKEKNIPIHIHLAETEEEWHKIRERYQCTPTRYLEQCGLLDGHPILLAHAVHLDEEDIALLGNIQGGVAHNPVSNFKLGCGIAPIEQMIAKGVTVGLGTDGAGSASSLDMFLTMQAASWMQKVIFRDPTRLSARRVLTMATQQGATILDMGSITGSLERGKSADLIVINPDCAHLLPQHDIANLLAYAAKGSDVESVMVNGQWLMHQKEMLLVDKERILFEATARAKRIVEGI
ncbi:amidohydrolase [Brevibacillus sp. SYSU BS000544]|uniref:amidohydrolase n=1 Tax=Brevibacillus sp. SYSU BS000544 TaxID=3416443 RepID=UPI003CE4A04F